MSLRILPLVFLVVLSCCKVREAPLVENQSNSSDLNTLSEEFILAMKAGKDAGPFIEKFKATTVDELSSQLKTDEMRYAFWINVYNAYIIAILSENPELYDDKGAFFSKDRIEIGGEKISFALIEHGLIRKSQWDKGLGYVRKWFPNSFERTLRVDKRDYRVHFALNCGAKDCPPVAIYNPKEIDKQLGLATQKFLRKTTEYDKSKNQVKVTSLFSWFRGDFGGPSGVREILRANGLVDQTKGLDLEYTNYDWTLDLDNFTEL